MFVFQNLIVYSKSKEFVKNVHVLLKNKKFNKTINDQLYRASMSILLNIAEGSGRLTDKDKRNFFVVARGSAFECAAIFEILFENNEISKEEYVNNYLQLEEISKMLFSYIQKLGGFQSK